MLLVMALIFQDQPSPEPDSHVDKTKDAPEPTVVDHPLDTASVQSSQGAAEPVELADHDTVASKPAQTEAPSNSSYSLYVDALSALYQVLPV